MFVILNFIAPQRYRVNQVYEKNTNPFYGLIPVKCYMVLFFFSLMTLGRHDTSRLLYESKILLG